MEVKNVRARFVTIVPAGLRVEWAEEDQRLGHVISVPPEVFVRGCVRDVDEGLAVRKLFSQLIIYMVIHTLGIPQRVTAKWGLCIGCIEWCQVLCFLSRLLKPCDFFVILLS